MIGLIDFDPLFYICSKDTLQESITKLEEKLEVLVADTKITDYLGFYSNSPYFRHQIEPDYKGNRTPTKLLWVKTLKEYCRSKYNITTHKGLEADDLVAYCNHNLEDTIICSIDKDLLTQLGRTYNYQTGIFRENTEEDKNKFFYYQTILGDKSDNILTPFVENAAKYYTNNNEDITLADILKIYIEGIHYETPTGRKKFTEGYGSEIEAVSQLYKNTALLKLLETDEELEKYNIEPIDTLQIHPANLLLNKKEDVFEL